MVKKSRENYSELSFEEQIQLVKNYRENKPKAWENLYKQYKFMIIKIANKFSGYNIPEEDRLQEATFGFLVAVQTYDETKGALFSTHAHNKIRESLWEYVRNCGEYYKIISNKENRKLFYHLRSVEERLNIDDNPTEEEYKLLAAELFVSVKNVKTMHKFWSFLKSMTNLDDTEEEANASTALDPEMFCIMENMNKKAQKIWLGLTETEKTIIGEVVVKEKSLRSVGEKLGYSAERIRQKKNDILQKLNRMTKE